ncbi:ribitol-5-phosphate transferase FKTN-like [Antedon mediterranea]|uniref:ribitol-5-phosphate transferase FKTN-like n=1 Tax=Antedon mediterranea TaxID=105859 RepID=UPI003AF6B147
MRKLTSLVLTLTVGALFLILQMLIIHKFIERSKSEVLEDQREALQTPVQYKAVHIFMAVMSKLTVPVVLVEPSILKAIMQKRLGHLKEHNDCEFVCIKRNKTTFSVLQHMLVHQQEELLSSLKLHGFAVFKTEGGDPLTAHQLMTSKLVPYHYLLVYQDHLIHLALLYERSDLYLWKGPLELPSSSKLYQINLEIGTFATPYPAAIKKFEVAEVKIDGISLKVPKRPNRYLRSLQNSKFLECDYQQAMDFYSVHGKDDSSVALDFKNRAIDVISQGQRILDELGVSFWLSSGTCLGWFRECSIIPHSKDVDFGIWAVDYKPNIISAFEMNGWMLKHILGKVEDSFELSFIHKNGLKLDLFFFYEEVDHVWNGGTDVYTAIKYKYSFPKFHLCWTEFQLMLVRVPCETEPYIKANYGKHWRKKLEEWDWKSSPPNVKENGRWLEEEYQDAIQVF